MNIKYNENGRFYLSNNGNLFLTGGIQDIDGNLYNTIEIGTQTWLLENLRTTKYRNGDPVTYINDNWTGTTTGMYSDQGSGNTIEYGLFYNWYVVSDSRNIAPEGTRVPTQSDFDTLKDYLVDDWFSKMRAIGTTYWLTDSGETNSSGFKAVGSGNISPANAEYIQFKNSTQFWTSTTSKPTSSNAIFMRDEDKVISFSFESDNTSGNSIRCILE